MMAAASHSGLSGVRPSPIASSHLIAALVQHVVPDIEQQAAKSRLGSEAGVISEASICPT